MTEKEVRFLLFKASANYLSTEIPDETKKLWIERLSTLPFEKGLENLNRHIDTNEFFPKISHIIGSDPEQFTDYNQLRIDTQIYLQQREERQQKAIECPPHLSRKHLTAGGSDQEDV